MLTELRVRELGVIVDLEARFGPGLTVITGETGTGKTLVIEALELALGGRADPVVVRAGASEAFVEARFVEGDDEVVLARAVSSAGRSRAYVDGRMATVAVLSESGADLVDLYGQHAHQSLLRPAIQRAALDAFAGIDLAPVRELRSRIAEIDRELAGFGGDERAAAREVDFLRFELAEIEGAAIASAEEEKELAAEEAALAGAVSLREAGMASMAILEGGGEAGALDQLGNAIEALGHREPLAPHASRLRALQAELEDAAGELREAAERFEEDPVRLAEVVNRRQLLRNLARKHGGDLESVLMAAKAAQDRITELESADEIRASLELQRSALVVELSAAESKVGDERRAAAGDLGGAVALHLPSLALNQAQVEVTVPESGIGDEVEFLLAANAGEPALPLGKVASGGELARAMLALRLVLTSAPPTLVFDEVDAGIGGTAAVSVGRALAELGRDHQVLVVTHLAQVAAAADQHLVVTKEVVEGRTIAQITPVEGEARVVELSRMLSGHPDSATAREHAAELLASARVPIKRVRQVASRAL